jgi:phosphonate transport system substrate-binding protein
MTRTAKIIRRGILRHFAGAAIAFVAAFSEFVPAACFAESGEISPFRVGFTSRSFGNVNQQDASAAIRVWVEGIALDRGIPTAADSYVYNDSEEMEADMDAGALDLVIILADEYLEMQTAIAEPIFTTVRESNWYEEYALLARRDAKVASMSDLQGKNLVILEGPNTSLAPQWLESRLQESLLPGAPDFFGRITRVSKVSGAVLPVFFRKQDACLVNLIGYRTVTELNPQIGVQLNVIAKSHAYPRSVICMSKNYQLHREDVIDALAQLHEGPRGQQILMVFRIDRLIPFDPKYFDHARELHEQGAMLPPRTLSPASDIDLARQSHDSVAVQSRENIR